MTDEELIARLRQDDTDFWHCEAADRIEALVKERDEAINQLDSARHSVDVLEKRVAHFMSRAERLEAAASSVADDVCSYICPSVGRAGEPILHDPHCIALRAALKGAEHE